MLLIEPNAQSATVVIEARGTSEIRSAEGKRTVAMKDPADKEVYSGALDTDEDMEKVPEDYRDWVRGVRDGGPAGHHGAPAGIAAEPRLETEPAAAGARSPTT